MLFAIDFDGTFDRDPKLFCKLAELLRSHGHSVVCVTSRFQGISDEVERAVGDMPIVYAGATWKRQAARAAGYQVHVWIEDLPEYVDRQDPEMVLQKLDAIA
jgi:GH25 family lysozyme M1 (1,4-beta-N-acetylmuramidase)